MEGGECRVYVKPAEVETRLRELGLVEADLTEAVRHGDQQAEFCTDNDPRVLKNFTRWGKTFRGLADRLISKNDGWEHVERRCFPLMVSAARSIALTVSSGDWHTGKDGPAPRTQNPKGIVTRQVVLQNQTSFPGMNKVTELPGARGPRTWFLLYYLDRQSDEIQAELSLAKTVDQTKSVSEWFERILLPPVPRSAPQLGFEEEDEGDIDITIEPRG